MSRATKPAALTGLALLTFAVVLGLAGCGQGTSKATDVGNTQADVDSLFQNYVDALNNSDSLAVRAAFAPGPDVTVAGRERFFRGSEGVERNTEGLLAAGENKFDIDSLDVVPIEKTHALAMVIYTVEPSDQDVPAFHATGTYLLEKIATKWRIIHAHVCPAREM